MESNNNLASKIKQNDCNLELTSNNCMGLFSTIEQETKKNDKSFNQLIEIIDDLNDLKDVSNDRNNTIGFDLKQEKAKLLQNKNNIDNDEDKFILPSSNQTRSILLDQTTISNSNLNETNTNIINNSNNDSQKSLCSSGATSTTSMNSHSNRDSLNSSSSLNHVFNIKDVTAAATSTDSPIDHIMLNNNNDNEDIINLVDFNKFKIICDSNNNNTEADQLRDDELCSNLPQHDQYVLINNHDENSNYYEVVSQSKSIEMINLCNQQEIDELKQNDVQVDVEEDEKYDDFDELNVPKIESNGKLKRTQLINLIFDLYDLNSSNTQDENDNNDENKQDYSPTIIMEGFMEKLPPGKNLKNSLLLAWRKRYFKLSSLGNLYEYDIDEKSQHLIPRIEPSEFYCLMGSKVEYEQNKTISINDFRGNCLVIRCCQNKQASNNESDELFCKWKEAIDSQTEDRSELLWVRPNCPLTDIKILGIGSNNNKNALNKKVLIVDIGTCNIRAGLFSNEPKLPKLFLPTVCAKDLNNNRYKVGFDAFDFLMSSSAPSTIDLHKSMSSWSLASTCSPLIFPLKTKGSIDKLNFDIDSIVAILGYVVETLNLSCPDHQIVIVTTHKLNDRTNIQFLNMLLADSKFKFESVTIINQTLLSLYAYNSTVGVVANLGEKIDIVPICNGMPFQGGVTNLAYGGTTMSEYLNSFISRGHINYVNDMEQYYVRYIKEKSCYAALNYQEELKKYQSDSIKFSLDLNGHANELKKVEFPESARFKSVEGLFNPEIWGIDGQGIHKLIFKAIQSTSMDLRREMARNIFLCGGMSRIPGLKDRLENELKALFPPALKIKVNCSDHSYHCAYLGAFRFIQQPEYEKLLISRDEWAKENVNCLRKWRMM